MKAPTVKPTISRWKKLPEMITTKKNAMRFARLQAQDLRQYYLGKLLEGDVDMEKMLYIVRVK